ncbi:hypothetical protein LJR231_002052 [Phyllobacterium sp. LjRoot231]|uniref:transcription termination/antitermination protein NusG n=1 Tax=Phyllobacterium sp. LjRoot231 TaxID=3342289 RepID=UPI003ECDC85E
MQFDDTRAARIHRKEGAKSKKATTEMRFPKGGSIWVANSMNPFVSFGGTIQEVTRSGRIKALLDIFGRMTPVEFEAGQLCPAA